MSRLVTVWRLVGVALAAIGAQLLGGWPAVLVVTGALAVIDSTAYAIEQRIDERTRARHVNVTGATGAGGAVPGFWHDGTWKRL